MKLEVLKLKFLIREVYESVYVVDHTHRMRKKTNADMRGFQMSVEMIGKFQRKRIEILEVRLRDQKKKYVIIETLI